MSNREKYLKAKAEAQAANIETLEETIERINRGGIVVTQMIHRPASVIANPKRKSAARAYADVGRY